MEKEISRQKLEYRASRRKDVGLLIVLAVEQDFWRSVRSSLNGRVTSHLLSHGISQVDELALEHLRTERYERLLVEIAHHNRIDEMVVVGAGKTLIILSGRETIYRLHQVLVVLVRGQLLEDFLRRQAFVVVLLLQIPQQREARVEP